MKRQLRKEAIGGYWIIHVRSREEALEWARRAPMANNEIIDVHQIYERADFSIVVQKAAVQKAAVQKAAVQKAAVQKAAVQKAAVQKAAEGFEELSNAAAAKA